MMKNLKILPVLALILITSVVWISKAQDAAAFVIDDFEVNEVFEGRDEFNNAIGHAPWGDVAGNVVLGVAQSERVDESSSVLEIKYDIGGWGGFTHAFTDGVNWISHDWTSHNALSFWLSGNNTSQIIQVELFDNRAPDGNADTAERFFFHVVDDYAARQQFTIPFAHFQRRSDWQPEGAPDDGFNLDAVSGYAFGLPAGTGGSFAIIDDVMLVFLPGVSMPEQPMAEPKVTQPAEVAQLADVVFNEALLTPMDHAEPVLVEGFENGLQYIAQTDGPAIGFVPWGDSTGNAVIGITQLIPFTELAIPESVAHNQVLRVDYSIGAWGGFTNAFNDGSGWHSQDWTGHNALRFWLYGNNTGQII